MFHENRPGRTIKSSDFELIDMPGRQHLLVFHCPELDHPPWNPIAEHDQEGHVLRLSCVDFNLEIAPVRIPSTQDYRTLRIAEVRPGMMIPSIRDVYLYPLPLTLS